jgi:hypothetical protein
MNKIIQLQFVHAISSYSVILLVLDPRKCEYLKDCSLDFERAYMDSGGKHLSEMEMYIPSNTTMQCILVYTMLHVSAYILAAIRHLLITIQLCISYCIVISRCLMMAKI